MNALEYVSDDNSCLECC